MLKYIELNKAKIRYMMVKNYKNSLKPLKELEKFKFLREQEIENATKRKLNVLNDTLETLKRFKAHENEINEIERLKEEVKNSNDDDHETKIFKLLTDLEYENIRYITWNTFKWSKTRKTWNIRNNN